MLDIALAGIAYAVRVAAFPVLALALIVSALYHYRRILPAFGMAGGWFLVCGMDGAMPGEVEGAGLVGALLRFLLSRQSSHKVTVAGFVSGVALARWAVPFAAQKLGVPHAIEPMIGLCAGLIGLDLARGFIERGPTMILDKLNAKKETGTGNESV